MAKSHGIRSRWILVYFGFLLNGMGVVLLGPLLPQLARVWALSDVPQGALLAAQFLGSSAGTSLVLRVRHDAVVLGAACSCAGMALFGLVLRLASSVQLLEAVACASLMMFGFGLGQVATALNLTAGDEHARRSARLAFGNAMWSVGAITSPLIVGFGVARLSVSAFLLVFAGAFAIFAAAALVIPGTGVRIGEATIAVSGLGVPVKPLIAFGFLMLFYGGAETCFSGWLTTFATRRVHSGEVTSVFPASTFWLGIAAGRFVASGVLQRRAGQLTMHLMLAGAVVCSVMLLLVQSLPVVCGLAAIIGALLGPMFPAILGELLSLGPKPRQAGLVLATCGAGAASFPLLLSVITQLTGSLQIAFLLPTACLLLMVVLVSRLPSMTTEEVTVTDSAVIQR